MRLLPVCSISLNSFLKYDNIFSPRNKLIGAIALVIFTTLALRTHFKHFIKNHSFSEVPHFASKRWSLCKQYLFDRTPSNRTHAKTFSEGHSQTDPIQTERNEPTEVVPKDVVRELFPLDKKKTEFSLTCFFTPNPRVSPLSKTNGTKTPINLINGSSCSLLIVEKQEDGGVLTGVTHMPEGRTAIGEFHDGLLWKGVEVSRNLEGGLVTVVANRVLNEKGETQYIGPTVVINSSSSSVRCDLPNAITVILDLNRQIFCVKQADGQVTQKSFSDLTRAK